MKYQIGIIGSLILLLLTVVFYGCEEQPVTGNRLVPGRLVPGRLVPGRLVGNVSNGLALPKTPVTIVSADGQTELSTTTDEKGNYSIEVTDDLTFPVLIVASTSNTSVSSIVTSAPANEEETTANVNPITQIVTLSTLGADAPDTIQRLLRDKREGSQRLIAATLSEITSEDFETIGQGVSELAFGEGVDFSSFASETYTAKTTDDPTGGNYQDTLIDSVANLSSVLTVEEILSRAIDPNDPSFDGELLNSQTFLATVSGELIAQGRSGEEALAVITSVAGEDTETLEKFTPYVTVFDEIAQDAADSGLTDQNSREALISASAGVIANTLEVNTVTDTTSLTTLLDNTVAAAGPALISIGQQNQDIAESGQLEVLLGAMSEELSDVLVDNAVDLTVPLDDTTSLSTQLTNFGQALAGPLVTSLTTETTGDTGESLTGDKQQVLVQNIAKQVSESLTPYLNDFTAGIPEAAQNTANNVGSALDTSLKTMLLDEQSQTLDGTLAESIIEQVAQATVTQIESTGADLTAGTLPTEVLNTANNMASIALEGVVSVVGLSSDLSSEDAQASVAAATLEQTFEAVTDLDLSGDLPPEANTVVNNVTQVVGSALVSSVGGVSNRKGENLSVLVKSAASAVTQELESTGVNWVEETLDVEAIVETANNTAAETSISMEQTFQEIEAAGVSLGEMTKSFEEVGLDADALLVVAAQVAETVASEDAGDSIQSATSSITKAAAETAQNVLKKGGSIDQVQQSVSVTTAALKDVAEGGDAKSIENSALALQAAINAAAQGEGGVEDLLIITENVATGVTLLEDASGAADLVQTVQTNVSQGEGVDLEDVVSEDQLDSAQNKQDDLSQKAEVSKNKANEGLENKKNIAKDAVDNGDKLDAFNAEPQTNPLESPDVFDNDEDPNNDGDEDPNDPIIPSPTPDTTPDTIPDTTPDTTPNTILLNTIPPDTIFETTSTTTLPDIFDPTLIPEEQSPFNPVPEEPGPFSPNPGNPNPEPTAPPGTTPPIIVPPDTITCNSTQSGPLDVANSACGAGDAHVIDSGHAVHWNGSSGAIHSHMAIHPGSSFTVHSSGGTLHGNLNLHGGHFSVQSNVTIHGDIVHHAHDSRISVSAGNVLTYNGLSVQLGSHTLQLDIAGLFHKPNNFSIPSGGELRFTGGGTMNTPITLDGGLLNLDSDFSLSGDLTHTDSSSIDIEEPYVFAYSGNEIDVGGYVLYFAGGGTYLSSADFLVPPGGVLHFSSGGTINAPIVLEGGMLEIDDRLTIGGDITHAGSSTIDISVGSTLTYFGGPIEVSGYTLSVTGGGAIENGSSIVVDQSSILQLAGGGSIYQVAVSGHSLTTGTIEVFDDFTIGVLTLANTTNIEVEPDKILTIADTLKVNTDVNLDISGQVYAEGIRLDGDLDLDTATDEDRLILSDHASLTINSTTTFGPGNYVVFGGGLVVAEGVTLYINDPDDDSGAIFYGGATINGQVVLTGNDDISFDPAIASTANITVATSATGSVFNELVFLDTALALDNSHLDLQLSKRSYVNSNGTGGLTTNSFTLSFNQNGGNATSASIDFLSDTDDAPLVGGESEIRFHLTIAGSASGVETIEITPADNNSIFDLGGNPASDTLTTGPVTLNDVSFDLASSLVVYYAFNDNANDSSGNGHHAVVQGAMLVADGANEVNNAYQFDGSDDYLQTIGHTNLAIASTLTISMWVYVANNSAIRPLIEYGGFDEQEVNNTLYRLQLDDGKLKTFWENGSGSDVFTGLGVNVDTGWHHVAMVREIATTSSTVKFYLDGALEETVTGQVNPSGGTSTSAVLLIGTNEDANYFDGTIDELRIYDRALKTNEILALSVAPVADPGQDQFVSAGQTVTLDGSDSSDSGLDGYIDSYQWQIAGQPSGSTITMTNANQATTAITLAVSGDYSFALEVSDGTFATSNSVNVVVNEWELVKSPASWSARFGHQSVVFQNKLWLMGGDDGGYNNDVWYSRDGVDWTQATLSAGWSDRSFFQSVVFDHKMWIMGGNDGNYKNDVWYSRDGVNWTLASSNTPWNGREFHSAAVYAGKMWIMGGYDGTNNLNDVWYSEDGANWTQATANASWGVRNGHQTVVFDNKLWVMGGYDGSFLNDVWYSQDGMNWMQATTNPDWSGRTVARVAVYDGKMWLTGGGTSGNTSLRDVWNSSDGINWLEVTGQAGWTDRESHMLTVFRSKLWFLGGKDRSDSSTYNDVWSYGQGIESGLIAYYPFHGDVKDVSSTDLHGLPIGATLAEDHFGTASGAYSFDGTDDYIDLGTTDYSFAGTQSFTLAAWVQPNAGGGQGMIVSKYNANIQGSYFLRLNTNRTVTFHREVSSFTIDSTSAIPEDSYSHLVATYDGATMRVYINGNLENSMASGSHLASDNTPILIGASLTNGNISDFFDGDIDDVRIYDRALSTVEVLNLFRAPVAVAGEDQVVDINTSNFTITANDSQSANGNTNLAYSWTLLEHPSGDNFIDFTPSSSSFTFEPVEIGAYKFELATTDGNLKARDVVTVYTDIESSSLVAFYPFDGHINNVSSNSNHGTIASSSTAPTLATTNWAGAFKNGYTFDGNDDYIEVSNSGGQFDLTEGTLMAWVRPTWTTDGGDDPTIFGVRNASQTRYSWHISGDYSSIEVWHGTSQYSFSHTINSHVWTHLALTLSAGGTMTVYANGVEVANTSVSFNTTTGLPLVIGRTLGITAQSFQGDIDDVRIYNTALEEWQIEELFATGTKDLGLVAYYPFSGSANDVSGNGYDGIATGGATLTTDRFGHSNNAYSFDGVDDHFLIASTITVNSTTMATWYKISGSHGGWANDMTLFGYNDGKVQVGRGNYNNDWKVIWCESTLLAISSEVGNDQGTWHHFAVTADQNQVALYIDGKLLGSGSASSCSNSINYIGRANFNNPNNYFNGLLDDIRVYNRALTELEIEDLIEDSPPFVLANTVTSDSSDTFTLSFNEGVYTNNDGSGGLATNDFILAVNQNGGTALEVSIASLANTNSDALVGGESSVVFELAVTGVPTGVEIISITPVSNSIFDEQGNPLNTNSTIATTLVSLDISSDLVAYYPFNGNANE